MNKVLLPKGLDNLRDTYGSESQYDLPRMIFAHGCEEGVLEHLVLSLYFRGGEEIIDKPYHVTETKQPLIQFYAGQLAIREIDELEIITLENAAKYLASEHILIVPSLCQDAVKKIEDRFYQAYKMFEDWKISMDSLTAAHVAKKFEEAIVPAARLHIPEVISLYNEFLNRYKNLTEGHDKPEAGWLKSNFDYFRRVIERTIQLTMNGGLDGIYKLSAELYDRPHLRNARLIDAFARNLVHLGFDSDKDVYYNFVRRAYSTVIASSAELEDKVSAYTSLIVFDNLLEDHDSSTRHLRELRDLASNHPKTVFIENLLIQLMMLLL